MRKSYEVVKLCKEKLHVDSFFPFVVIIDLRSRLSGKKGSRNEVQIKKDSTVKQPTKIVKERELSARIQQIKPQNEAKLPKTKESTKKEPTATDSSDLDRERELDARIQRIKQQNEAILKRAKEIQAEKMKFHS